MASRTSSRLSSVEAKAMKLTFLCFLGFAISPTHGFSFHPRLIIPTQPGHCIHPRGISSPHPRTFPFVRMSSKDEDEATPKASSYQPPPDILVAETSLGLKRASWLSWWAQMILTITSSVILIFAKNVVSGMRDAQVNFLLSGCGIVVSFMSIFWTWGGGARLSRRLLRRPTSRIQAAKMLRKAIDVGVSLNLIGMFLTLLGAEQTVGVLAIKVLTARPWNNPGSPFMATFEGSLQPLDILVVQANTNSLLSHFFSLVTLLYLTRYVKKLDPPSEEEKDKVK